MSWWLGALPRPGTSAPFSVRLFSFPSLLFSLCRSLTSLRDHDALLVVPRSATDPVLRVHRRLSGGGLGAQVGAPRHGGYASSISQRLAVGVGAGESAEFCAVARAGGRDEEAHRVLRCDRGGTISRARSASFFTVLPDERWRLATAIAASSERPAISERVASQRAALVADRLHSSLFLHVPLQRLLTNFGAIDHAVLVRRDAFCGTRARRSYCGIRNERDDRSDPSRCLMRIPRVQVRGLPLPTDPDSESAT